MPCTGRRGSEPRPPPVPPVSAVVLVSRGFPPHSVGSPHEDSGLSVLMRDRPDEGWVTSLRRLLLAMVVRLHRQKCARVTLHARRGGCASAGYVDGRAACGPPGRACLSRGSHARAARDSPAVLAGGPAGGWRRRMPMIPSRELWPLFLGRPPSLPLVQHSYTVYESNIRLAVNWLGTRPELYYRVPPDVVSQF